MLIRIEIAMGMDFPIAERPIAYLESLLEEGPPAFHFFFRHARHLFLLNEKPLALNWAAKHQAAKGIFGIFDSSVTTWCLA